MVVVGVGKGTLVFGRGCPGCGVAGAALEVIILPLWGDGGGTGRLSSIKGSVRPDDHDCLLCKFHPVLATLLPPRTNRNAEETQRPAELTCATLGRCKRAVVERLPQNTRSGHTKPKCYESGSSGHRHSCRPHSAVVTSELARGLGTSYDSLPTWRILFSLEWSVVISTPGEKLSVFLYPRKVNRAHGSLAHKRLIHGEGQEPFMGGVADSSRISIITIQSSGDSLHYSNEANGRRLVLGYLAAHVPTHHHPAAPSRPPTTYHIPPTYHSPQPYTAHLALSSCHKPPTHHPPPLHTANLPFLATWNSKPH
ncbi:hypothetical protein E2C01_025462 [Portunus trituberculatus]|uniref:Uncharacterized protein n=1 Tax=Portunus trituberculatus TaxID=210409 RepID=A0A5B7EFZ7_PORTR|nr:hypothetical protein [Portunus trituberculatus]